MRVYAQLLQKLSQDSMSIESLDRFFRDVSGSGEYLDIFLLDKMEIQSSLAPRPWAYKRRCFAL